MKKSPASFAIKICCQLVLWEKKKKGATAKRLPKCFLNHKSQLMQQAEKGGFVVLEVKDQSIVRKLQYSWSQMDFQ